MLFGTCSVLGERVTANWSVELKVLLSPRGPSDPGYSSRIRGWSRPTLDPSQMAKSEQVTRPQVETGKGWVPKGEAWEPGARGTSGRD